MRVIKFRGFDEEHNIWRHGHLARLVEGARRFWAIICDNDDGELVRYYIHKESSIGQFTGLTDRNGVDVYESDVVRDGDVIGIVEYVSDSAAFIVDYSGGAGRWLARLDAESETTEVIGNIHEHPELLEAKP